MLVFSLLGDNIAVYPNDLVSSRQRVAPRDLALELRQILCEILHIRSETKFAGRTFRSTPEAVSLGAKVKGKAMTTSRYFVLWVNIYIIA